MTNVNVMHDSNKTLELDKDGVGALKGNKANACIPHKGENADENSDSKAGVTVVSL